MGMRFYLILPVYVLIFFHSSAVVDCSKHDFLGVNVLGLKAGIHSNLFSKDGPLAKAVDNLKTLKQNSDNFWNDVGQNTANILNKVGSALTGSSNSGSSATGSVSVDGNTQGLLPENEEKGSRNEGTTNVKVSLTRKSTGSLNGDSSSSGGFSNSGSSSSSDRGSGSASFTLPGNNFNGNSQNIETADSTNQYLNNDSGNVDNEESGTINLPTIVINGGGSGFRPPVSSSHESTGWSLSGRSRSNSGISSTDDSSSNIPTRTVRGRTESSPIGSSSSGSWHLRKVYHRSSSADVSPSLHLEETSGSGYGELKPNITTSEWSVDDSGSSAGSSNQQSSQNSSQTTKWSFRDQNSGQNDEQMSNDENKEESISSSENAGGDSSASPSGNLVGVNVLGLKAGFCTNLFDKEGPLAKAGENLKNILEGKKLTNLDDLNNILGVNIGDMKADLTTNLFGNGKASNAKGQQEILGKSILGFHEGLNTNIFSGNGPIAKVGNDLKNLLEGKLSLGDLISGNGSASSSNKDLVGVNALGVKLALCTNLFDRNGPLAKAGADVSSFFKNLGEINAKLWSNIRNALGGGSA
ncbi:hypothetical protein WA026_019877 [Henosepilachna vigintioctopunctata]|uniref:Uncharacterized protein n=1 Tax=Henosepilachna vigintioctopunctata TaxID=420089 RepID=A0AAW1VIS0_9CUCU